MRSFKEIYPLTQWYRLINLGFKPLHGTKDEKEKWCVRQVVVPG